MTNYTKEELKKIQQIELRLLKEFVNVCNQLKVDYFLVGGSAIGAMRHNGFIPWDDDIDVGMFREDYGKFISEASRLLGEDFYIQAPSQNERSPFFYAKLRLNGTVFMEYSNHRLQSHPGIYIDIFPFDEVPIDDVLHLKQFKRVQKLIKLYTYHEQPDVSFQPNNLKEKLKALIRRTIYYTLQLIPHSLILNQLNQELKKYDGTNQQAFAGLDYPRFKKSFVKKEEIYPLKQVSFEGIDVNVFQKIENYLTRQYGDFMELPPEKDRVGHKPYIVDLGKYSLKEDII
ncbi:LicD family protein [Streptococcus suis]